MDRDMDAARDRSVAVPAGRELPAPYGIDRRLIEMLVEAMFVLDLAHLLIGVDGYEEDDGRMEILIFATRRIDGGRALEELRRRESFFCPFLCAAITRFISSLIGRLRLGAEGREEHERDEDRDRGGETHGREDTGHAR